MKSSESSAKRLPYLDAARGLAALNVVIWHYLTAFFPYDQPSFIRDSPLHFFWYGEADILFFFIHSGFVLAYSYTGFGFRLRGGEYLKFLIARAFRIYPLYLLVLLSSYLIATCVYPLAPVTYFTAHFRGFWDFQRSWRDLAKQAVLIVRMPDSPDRRYLPQDWTLTVELLFSFMLPVLSRLMKRNKWMGFLLVMITIRVLKFNTYLFEFAVGVFIFYSREQLTTAWNRVGKAARRAAGIVALALVTCLFHFSYIISGSHLLFSFAADRLIIVSGCVLFFVLLINSPKVQWILSRGPLVRIGKVCYGIYLWHVPILIAGADYGMQVLRLRIGLPFLPSVILLLIIVLVLTIGVSLFTYTFVEKPFIVYGKAAGRRLGAYIEKMALVILP